MLKLYNTLTRKIEDFQPINPPNVGLYICGPTVYDFMHIGNLRTFTFGDILHRSLKANKYEVKVVENITDIDDKIIKRAKERDVSIQELAEEFTRYFLEDIYKLNILPANVQPKATEHIGAMIKYIEDLIEKGYAYVEKDGSVYFDISKFPNYGRLSQVEKRQLKSGTRVLSREARELRSSDEYSKDDIQDFALWKTESKDAVGWDSPWGWGRPGWHIECSVMSQQYLGDTFDIHAGGVDLLFPHHENEIAQSEAKTSKKFVIFFVHGEHILVDGQKMSKSLKNFYSLKDLEEKGFDPLVLRYLFLTAHYQDKLNFTWQSLEAAQRALNNLRSEIRAWEQPKEDTSQFWQKFWEAANNNLNIPQAVALMWDMVHSDIPTSSKSKDLLEMDKILGLGLEEYLGKLKEVKLPKSGVTMPIYVAPTAPISGATITRLDMREIARQKGDYQKSDEIRNEIEKEDNLILQDKTGGTVAKEKLD